MKPLTHTTAAGAACRDLAARGDVSSAATVVTGSCGLTPAARARIEHELDHYVSPCARGIHPREDRTTIGGLTFCVCGRVVR